MAAPAAATSAGSKRKADDEAPNEDVPASKVVKPLDAEAEEEDRLEIWMEPRFCCDWTIVVELEGYTLRAHVHRMQLGKASPEWWVDRIKDHQNDHPDEPFITFKRGEGAWENRAELVLYLHMVYASDHSKELINQFPKLEASSALPLERLLHACDFTHFKSGFDATETYIKWLVDRSLCVVSRCIRLAERYRWKWMYDSFIKSIIDGSICEDEMDELWESQRVATAIGPLIASKMSELDTRVRSALVVMQKYHNDASATNGPRDTLRRVEDILRGSTSDEEEEE